MSGYFYQEHPRTCDPDDFWGQVKRTVNGKPVPQEQIDMIVAAVRAGLGLTPDDVVLDLCCGNGALTTYFFSQCLGGVGVDFSEYLIGVARQNFSRRPTEQYVVQDAVEFARSCPQPERFTKALCFGAFMFLPAERASELLAVLRQRFPALARLYIGNLPDKDCMGAFFRDGEYRPGIEDDHTSPTGIWRTSGEFMQLADSTGWIATIHRMAPAFYAAHYRFDAVLQPKRPFE